MMQGDFATMSGDFSADPVRHVEAPTPSPEIEARLEDLREAIREGIDSGESIPGKTVFGQLERRAAELVARPH
jgi:hypothetical protein